ncbi:MAG: DNA gyrase subunit B [Eubacteriales bacterium]|nr:DNA gyrase subunit B [Eubacteriales bacterium]
MATKKTNKESTYTADNIEILDGLDGVRVRPGMYIGGTGSRGLHHILWEIIDNAMDEACNGYANKVTVILHKDGSAEVSDNGRGIPVGKVKKTNKSAVEVIFTTLHAGGKFNNSNYQFSGGLHGVGASVTNALSRWLTVESYIDGKAYRMEFHSPEVNGKVKSGIPKGPLEEKGKTKKKGTTVTFMPDDRVFLKEKFKASLIMSRLQETAFLNKNIEMEFIDERGEEVISQTYHSKGGVVDFVKFINEGKTALYDKPIYIEGEDTNFKLEIAIQHINGDDSENVYSFVNNIPTIEGGTHITGFRSGLTKVLNDYARKTKVLKDKDPNFDGEDFRQGISAIVSVKMQDVQFEGQTKTKLGNTNVKLIVENIVTTELDRYFQMSQSKKTLEFILKQATVAKSIRMKTKLIKDKEHALNDILGSNLVGKLSSCSGRKAEDNELFIVEGDSAGGSAKMGRDRKTQAILPLRGKPLNAEKKRVDQILQNEEIRSIISAIGAGIDPTFDLSKIKYHKVIILADADQDGAHIRAILLTFFYRYMKELVLNGNVYIGMPPLYKIERKNQVQYAYDDEELRELTEGKPPARLQRYKGLGEMNPEQLWETTMNPKTRSLMRVTVEDAVAANEEISILMGDNIELRKQYINKHANFNKVDTFELIGRKK